MITLSSAMETQKNTLAGTENGPWIWLVTLDRDGTNYLRYALGMHSNVTFNSLTYSAMNGAVQPPQSDAMGTTKNFRVTIQNVDQTMVTDLENGEFLDRPVVLELVHEDLLSSASNVVRMRGVVISADVDEQYATFNCGTYDLRNAIVPACTYSRERCRWIFKSDECGYAGGQTSCDKTISTCENTMSNHDRFGGFPGLPMLRP